jgi:hypothetical protein
MDHEAWIDGSVLIKSTWERKTGMLVDDKYTPLFPKDQRMKSPAPRLRHCVVTRDSIFLIKQQHLSIKGDTTSNRYFYVK